MADGLKNNFRIQNGEVIYNTPLWHKHVINATLLQGVINIGTNYLQWKDIITTDKATITNEINKTRSKNVTAINVLPYLLLSGLKNWLDRLLLNIATFAFSNVIYVAYTKVSSRIGAP